jgi:hypothetical protein
MPRWDGGVHTAFPASGEDAAEYYAGDGFGSLRDAGGAMSVSTPTAWFRVTLLAYEVILPWWSLVITSALLPLALALGVLKRLRRLLAVGTCLNCGYDLRASTGRCPECGEAIVPASRPRKFAAAG